ncbi:MAG: TIGR03747 family integrating conjugative element membrane protein [Roseateles sp.]
MKPAGTVKPRAVSERGPVVLVMELVFGLLFITMASWGIGVLIEIIGCYTLWEDQGEHHIQSLVKEDLGYISAAPRSVLIDDTTGFAKTIVEAVTYPYERLGAIRFYRNQLKAEGRQVQGGLSKGMNAAASSLMGELSRYILISMFVLQDVLLRMSIALFALPAFLLACVLGAVDGLMRRDLRRWGGGRESSFVYHHAKKFAIWALTGGFVFYLSWPFGHFNPAYMVLIFTVLVAYTLSTALSAFKKYV